MSLIKKRFRKLKKYYILASKKVIGAVRIEPTNRGEEMERSRPIRSKG
jgi:hypothetical protein